MKILIFGTGRYFINRQKEILDDDSIVAFIDNRADLIGSFQNKIVYKPKDAVNIEYDAVLVMSADREGMVQQLLDLGYDKKKIILFEEYQKYYKGTDIYQLTACPHECKKRILIISEPLKLNGGALSAINAAIALVNKNYSVTILARDAEKSQIDLLMDKGIGVAILKTLPVLKQKDISWCSRFDSVIVNTILLFRCAIQLNSILPCVLWVHESSDKYYDFFVRAHATCWQYDSLEELQKTRIIAVSELGKAVINSIYPKSVKAVVAPAIEDTPSVSRQKCGDIIIGLIAGVKYQKGCIEFVEAVSLVQKKSGTAVKGILVGNITGDDYGLSIKRKIEENRNINITGPLERSELNNLYDSLDVVVCASYEETLSLTIVEGMMHSKICITTDNTGIAEYIEDGVNGFICKAGDVDSLRDKMQYVIDHFDELDDMRKKARQTYEKYFTLEVLGENLEREINIAVEEFNKKHKTPSS